MPRQEELDELKHRQELARRMGGDEGIARQHSKGRLTVRERIDLLLDKGSFEEIGTLAGDAGYDENGKLASFTPSNVVTGYGRISDRLVCIVGDDFTIRGGALQESALAKRAFIHKMALDWHVPLINLYDAVGGSVTEGQDRTIMSANIAMGTPIVQAMSEVPVIAAVLGSAAGWIAVIAAIAHFNIMTKHTSELFVGGPPLIKRALNIDITKEELGNYRVHACQSGVIDNVGEDEQDVFRQIKLFLSYLPQNVWEQPPRVETADDPNRRDDELLSVVPEEPEKTFDIRKIIRSVLDKNSIFEITPHYGKSCLTMLARMDGHPVAVISYDCRWLSGAQDVPAAEKITRFIDFADTFHLPIIYLVDIPGYMIGPDAEKTGTIKKAARVHCAVHQATVPSIPVIIRRCYGVAGAMPGKCDRRVLRYAWPSAQWGSLPIAGGAMAAFRRVIESAPDPEAKRLEIESYLKQIGSPFRTAEVFGKMGIEEIINPRDTRPLLCDFVKRAYKTTETQLGPKYRGMRP